MRVIRCLVNRIKKRMKGFWVGLKVMVEWIIILIFTVICILISFHLLRSFFTFNPRAFFPMTPASIGESSVYPLVIDETISQKLFIVNEFQTPNLKTTSDSLARYLFQDFNLPVEASSDHQQEKRNLIEALFPFQTLDSVAPYVEVIQQLPKELLELMVRDELYFIVSNYSPQSRGENKAVLGYYEPKENRIIFYDDPHTPTAIIHEIGHWVASYLKHQIDFFYLKRIGDEMRTELENLNLPTQLLAYAKTDIHEFFAVSFEVYFYHYEGVKSQAPILFEYFSYYLIELLKTYDK